MNTIDRHTYRYCVTYARNTLTTQVAWDAIHIGIQKTPALRCLNVIDAAIPAPLKAP